VRADFGESCEPYFGLDAGILPRELEIYDKLLEQSWKTGAFLGRGPRFPISAEQPVKQRDFRGCEKAKIHDSKSVN